MNLADLDWEALARTTAVLNGKGGVLKTSITANLSGLIAQVPEYRVLAVDMDVQGNLAEDLGLGERADNGAALKRAVMVGDPVTPLRDVRPGLDVVCGGEELADLSAWATMEGLRSRNRDFNLTALVRSLAPISADYDFTFIDCPPGDEALQEMALGASRWVLVPTKTDNASRKGLRTVAARFSAAREARNTYPLDLDLLGVVLAGVTSTAKSVRAEARTAIVEDLGGDNLLLDSVIRHAESAAVGARNRGVLVHELVSQAATAEKWWQAAREGRKASDISKYQSNASNGLVADYAALAREVLERINEAESNEADATTQRVDEEARA